jgi:hypothetical protein
MSAQIDRRMVFAETCRSRAADTCFPFRRDHLLILASLSEREAGLVQLSCDCVMESRDLIAHANILLHRR